MATNLMRGLMTIVENNGRNTVSDVKLPIPATPENIAKAKAFLLQKWKERAREIHLNKVQIAARFSNPEPEFIEPSDLSNACKFSSMFAQKVFGGQIRGNYDHQFVVLPNKSILDLNIDAADVKAMAAPHRHDRRFFGNSEHKDAMRSCEPRVRQWVAEFVTRIEIHEAADAGSAGWPLTPDLEDDQTEVPHGKMAYFDAIGDAFMRFWKVRTGEMVIQSLHSSPEVRGRAMVRWLKDRYGLPIIAMDALPSSMGFWAKMQQEGLVARVDPLRQRRSPLERAAVPIDDREVAPSK